MGSFPESNRKHLEGAPDSVPIFEAKVTGDLHLVYRVDIDTDYSSKVCDDTLVVYPYGLY